MATHYGISPSWGASTHAGRTHIATNGVNQSGLVFNVDFGVSSSYSGSGTTTTDIKSNYAGAIGGTVSYNSSFYGGLVLDGTINNRILFGSIPIASALSVTTNFTIEQIFKPTSYQASNYYGIQNQLLSKGSASTYNYAVQPTSDTIYSFTKRTSPEGLIYHSFTVPSMLNKINVVTISVTASLVTCYYNGNLISSTALLGTPIAAVDNDPFIIGGLGVTYTNFIGVYYAGRIYNRTLSDSEILKNFNAVRTRYSL